MSKKLFFLLIIFSFYSFGFKYAFKCYKNSDGLPQSQIISITQDSIGRIWISTHCGIAFYDGYKFNVINKKIGLPTNYVYNILFNKNKICGAGSFAIFEIDLSNQKINSFNFPYVIRDFLPVDNGYLYAIDEGIFLNTNNHREKRIIASAPSKGKKVLEKKGNFYYFLSEDKIFKINKNFELIDVLKFKDKFNTFKLAGDKIFLGGRDGFYIYEKGNLFKLFECNYVNDILLDGSTIWVSTYDGLYFFQNNKLEIITKEEGLPSNEIYCIFKDRENIIWIGTDNGIAKLQSTGFKNYVEEKGLLSGSIWTILEEIDGKILFGGDKGFGILKNGKLKEIKFPEIANDSLRKIIKKNGKYYFAFKNSGIFYSNSVENINLKKINKKNIEGLFSIFIDSKDRLWAGTKNGLYLISNGKEIFFDKNNGLPDDTVFKIVEDPSGKILVLTDGGIAELKEEGFEISENYKKLKGYSTRAILFEGEKVWVGTLGNGIFLYDGKKWENINEEKGFPSDSIWSMEKDDLGFLWLGTGKGIVMLAEDYFCLFNSDDGLLGEETTLNGVLKTKDGKLWFGLVNGAVFIDPYKIQPNLNPPNLYIEKIETEEREILPSKKITLKPREKKLSIYFNGLSFQDEKEIYYSYRLLPIEEWSKRIKEKFVTYGNLKPGDYVFEVKACNASFIWNDSPLRIEIRKLPRFYEKKELQIIIFLIFSFLLFGFYKLRTKSIKKEKERLEMIISEKTKELQERLKELYVLSTTDFLTKVYNRGHFEKLLKEEFKKEEKGEKTVGIAIIDFDRFKDLNDEFGHSVGDKVLIEFGKILKNNFRTSDIVARYGGDEFVILFKETEREGCVSRLENLMKKVKTFVYESEEKKISLSLSIGVVFAKIEKGKRLEPEVLIKKADKALYEAKERGRDKMVVYEI